MVKKKVMKKRVVSEREKELKKVLVACGESIGHWEVDILENGEHPNSINCALCQLNAPRCTGCIVQEFTDNGCDDTGFDTYHELELLIKKIAGCGIVIKELGIIKDVAAKVEIHFLEALKALTVERLKNERLESKIKLLQG